MALKKTLVVKGVSCDYHKIIELNNKYLNGITEVIIAVYLNETVRRANTGDYISIIRLAVRGTDLKREDVYDLLMAGDYMVNGVIDNTYYQDAENTDVKK